MGIPTTASVVAQLSCVCVAVGLLLYSSLVAVPRVIPTEAGAADGGIQLGGSHFSERRALDVTRELSTRFPSRHVSHMDLEGATEYLYGVLSALADETNEQEDANHDVRVFIEQVAGANGRQVAFGFPIANVYNNLTNVVMTIEPRSGDDRTHGKKLLVNAHYDATLGSPGASDCASCVGVGVEVARVLLKTAKNTNAVFLFNGGEETLMQAAHGFMRWSPSAKDVGAFINIESTGPWGPDVLFQHQGWALDAYAKAAPRPRGNSVAQDFFELGVIPADTDYRVLRESSDDAGNNRIPGIDLAFLFDGLAYHTKEDTWTRIRPGTLQGMGENVLAAAVEFMEVLCNESAAISTGEKGFNPGKSVFADVGGRLMVVYPFWLARVLHVAPLAFHVAFFGRARVASRAGNSGVSAAALGDRRRDLADVLASVALALLLPSFLGMSRALVSGLPLSWYGSVPEACLMYIPAALAGLLMPVKAKTKREADAAMQAMGLVFAVVAFVFTAAGMTSSYVAAAWAAAAALSVYFDGSRQSPRLLWAIFLAPCYFGCGIAATTMLHVVEKIGIAGGADGALGKTVADGVVGFLAGVSTLLSVGALAPWLAFILGEYKRPLCRTLVLASTLAAVLSTSYRLPTLAPKNGMPYTREAPKRMIIQHIMRVDGSGRVAARSISACSMDAIPVGLPGILPESVLSLEPEAFEPRDWVSFYPLNFLVTGMTFRDDVSDSCRTRGPEGGEGGIGECHHHDHPNTEDRQIPSLSKAPLLYSVPDSLTRYARDMYAAAKQALGTITDLHPPPRRVPTKRHYFQLDTVSAGWAVLNITADIMAWSLGDEIASVQSDPRQHIIRYASGAFTSKWQFWVDVPRDNPSVEVELFVKHFGDLEPHVAAMVSDFGEHVSAVGLTQWQRRYSFV